MSIISLMKRVQEKVAQKDLAPMNRQRALRRGYLTGIAMQAYADGVVASEEKELFLKIAESFEIALPEAEEILSKAVYAGEHTLLDICDNLLDSKHKYYFILDLSIMAHQDSAVTEVEREVIRRFGQLLEIEDEDMLFLTELADALIENDPQVKDRWVSSFFKKKLRIGPKTDVSLF